MRKVLSFVLVLALVLGSFSMAFAATPTDVAGTDYSEAVTVLSGLGVVAGYADGTYKPAQAVTRAEMAKLIVVALGLEDYAIGTSKFADMAGATWAQGYVNYAAGLGVILGYPDGTFKPSQTVSYDEAAAMIVRALGYTDASLLPATWPANYVVKAKALGILADVTSKAGGADRGDVAIMLYNALSLKLGAIDNDSGKWVATSPDDKMITRLGAVYVANTQILPTWVGDADKTSVDLTDYVYAYANYYTVDGVIVSIADVESDSVVGEFTTGGAVVTNASIILANDDIVSLAGITAATDVYFNGGIFDTYTDVDNLMDGYDATVYGTLNSAETSFTTVDGIVAWAPTAIYKADKTDLANISDAIIDGNGEVFGVELPSVDAKGKALDLAKITVVGAATKLADIKADDVVYVYASKLTTTTETKVKFEVVRNAVTVKLTKISATQLFAGTTAYKFGTLNTAIGDPLATQGGESIGDTWTFYLGNDGKIAYETQVSSTPDNFGAVTVMAKAPAVDFGTPVYKLQMLTADNDLVVFELDDTVSGLTNAAVLVSTGTGIEYSVDSDGLITSIASIRTELAGTYVARSNSLAGKFVSSDLVVFNLTATVGNTGLITGSTTDWEVGSLVDGDNFDDHTTPTAFYAVDSDTDEIVAIMYHEKHAGTSTANYFAVNTAATVQNASEDLVLEITGFKEGIANTSLGTKALGSTLPTVVPAVWAVTYSGIEVTSYAAIDNTPDQLVDDASDTYLSISGSSIVIYDVAVDVLVYVEVYDADGLLDSYRIGSMSDVTSGDRVEFVDDLTDGVKLIVVTQRADTAASYS